MSAQSRMPRGIPYIIGNEAAERYSYYGMRSILVVFMTKYLMDAAGNPDHMTPDEAKSWYHLFGTAAYFFPILGALISDIFWGKYHTIIRLSVIYCLGHLTLALFETRMGLATGLTLIAIGTGGIKPCVSAHVGDQFNKTNQDLLERVFSYFYFAINFGAFFSILLTPIFLEKFSPGLAFGIPGILMFIATVVFWLGRHKFIAIPAAGWDEYRREVFSAKGKKAFLNLGILYFFIAAFWSLFEQQGSSWVLQAEQMNRMVDLRFGPFQADWLHFELLASQISALNPIIIMVLIPLFTHFIYPGWNKIWKATPLRKIGTGIFLAGFSFAIIALAQWRLDAGQNVSILWQFVAYIALTAAEVMVSITALEYAYTQAPNTMKSFVMSFYLLSVSFGNSIAATVNLVIQNPDGTSKLAGASYFWFFVGLTVVFGLGFIFFAKKYKEENYVQEIQPA
ncbi:MAG: POT family MFS transporter [Bdellovibrionales bacterium]|nr:POT family MFS transporter [Bdellovibrionales bacterium]